MPPKGGLSEKVGNIYEAKIAVVRAFDLIDDLCDTVRIGIEEPGLDAFEWWVEHGDGSRQYSQVKRQLFADTEWRIADLVSRGILGSFGRQLGADERATCAFYSTLSASHLQELTESARAATSLAEFEAEFVKVPAKAASWTAVKK